MVQGQVMARGRHTSHCSGCSKDSSSRRITPAVCPVFTFVPSHPTTFMFCVFAFSSFRLATNDSVMSFLEPDCGVVWLKYEEPGSATMLMCSSVRVFLWYLFSTPRTCISLILSTIKKYYLYARVVKLVTIQLEFLTIFPAFSADLASIFYFRPVDRRRKTKIMQN